MRVISWGIGLCSLFLVAAGIWLGIYILTPSTVSTDTVVYIPKGAGVRNIKTLLSQKGLIRDDIRFLILTRISGAATRLRAGEYLIPPHLKPLQILRILEKGEVVRHHITIPEGMTIRQIAGILEKDNWIDPDLFSELSSDKQFIQTLGLELNNLEGYLFPDTYSLARGEVTEHKLLTMMVNRFLEVWKDITADLAMDIVRHQIVILASIVEKETAAQDERPLIARVFLNRLEKRMRLQSDPTVIYGIEDFSGNLTRDDLRRKTPYNTYLISGLPAGPICNPGKESIMAVLRPADAPYLYFVSKNDGTHQFSSTLREHNRAVKKYQKGKTRQNSKENNSEG